MILIITEGIDVLTSGSLVRHDDVNFFYWTGFHLNSKQVVMELEIHVDPMAVYFDFSTFKFQQKRGFVSQSIASNYNKSFSK